MSRRPYRVLHVIAQLTHGGAEFQLKGLVQHGTGDDFQHAVACLWRSGADDIVDPIRQAGVEVFFLDKHKSVDVAAICRLIALIRRWRPDVVHTWLQSGGLWGRLAAMWAGRPAVVAAFRGEQLHTWPGGKYLDRWLDKHTDVCIVNSRRLQKVLARRLARAEGDIQLVVNGLDGSRFSHPPADPDKRSQLGLPKDGPIVTMVGTMREVKNWPLFVDVARRVAGQRADVCFVGVGGGPKLGEMRDHCRRVGVEPGPVRLLGKRTDVPEILAQSDLFLLTSDFEGMPNAVLEAMASGLGVVATRCSGTEEVVRDGGTGFLADVGDAAGLADRIVRCLDDAALRESLGQAGRRRVLQEFSFEHMAAGHRQAYVSAINRRAGLR